MKKLFPRKEARSLPTSPTDYPVGSAVRTENGVFYIKPKYARLHLPTQRVVDSWSFHRIIETTEAAVKHYKRFGKLGFRSGSLIHNLADGKIYLVSENKLRHIKSPEALERIGAVYDDAITVSEDEIKLHDIGDSLS